MPSKGALNVEATISELRKTLTSLGDKAKPEWQASLNSIIQKLEDMKDLFFMKSNIAVPTTSACLKDATELSSLAAAGNISSFPEALARLQTSMDTLIDRSSLDGVSLT